MVKEFLQIIRLNTLVDETRVAKGCTSCEVLAEVLVHSVDLKPIIKAQILGKLVTSGIGDVATASVQSEKTCLKKLIMIFIIIMNKSQETTFFQGRQKLTSAMKQRPEKSW